MPKIVDYASLTQAILDYTHRPTLSTYTDYFIQAAQEEINDDVFAENFGNGIRYMEAQYPATAINNGQAPVPSDWLAPKNFTILDGSGNQYGLEFKDAQWIYNRYPMRSAAGIPAYIGRDAGAASFDASNNVKLTSGAGQTSFDISAILGSVLFATLDGLMLTPSDYSVSGSNLTLANGALAGQVLFVQGIATASGFNAANYVKLSSTAGQTAFSISGLAAGSNVLFAALDGAMLVPSTDYNVAGTTLTLTKGALVGQTLFVQGAPSTLQASASSVFVFGPYPDSAYTIEGVYYQAAPILSATQTTNWMVLNAPPMLFAKCMCQAGKFLKDTAMVQGWTQLYTDALEKLILRDAAARFGEAPLVINTQRPAF